MASSSILYSLLGLGVRVISAVVITVLAYLFARRGRSTALWWMLVALGIWPVCNGILGYMLTWILPRTIAPTNSAYFFYQSISSICITLISLLLQIIVVVKVAHELRTSTLPPEPRCPLCGYNVTGLPDNRCPECGTRFVADVRYLTREVSLGE